MRPPRWITHSPAYAEMNKKKILAEFALPDGGKFAGVGEIWQHASQDGMKSEVVLAFEDDANYPVICQYRIHLSEAQAKRIAPSQRSDCHYIYEGTLVCEE